MLDLGVEPPCIKFCFGTGHYLSPGGGGRFLGDHLIFRKGGISRTENSKGGSLKTLEGFRGGTTQICLAN